MRDPIDENIHKYREEHARAFHFDLAAVCEDLRAFQQPRNLKVVRLPPKRIGRNLSPAIPFSCIDDVRTGDGDMAHAWRS